eukprot:TRINITY_DN229_c0_g2_i6.p1 TRINITY_DN229_c0_g2~~TRINITY_DN229_c0_g2_i6.p1  ORF type:complete len:219 (-),score=45.32 TRINITY_DN229_c0_g2_i6:112-768(-)
MSKLNEERLNKAIKTILDTSSDPKTKKKFLESIELQVRLKNYDEKKDKKFNGVFRLPHVARPKLVVAVVADKEHAEEAKANNIPYIDVEGLQKFNKDKKQIRKWVHQYDTLVGSPTLVQELTKLTGPTLNKMNKFPTPVNHNEPLTKQIDDVRSTIRFQLKKEMGFNCAVGNVGLKEEQLKENITFALNSLVGLLKKGWQNIGAVHIKTSMGKPIQIL